MHSALVVSTGRTGTESIARNFSKRYPDAAALHEPFGSRLLRITGNMYAAGMIGDRTCGLLVRMTYGLRRRKFTDRVYIESNPQLAHLVPVVCREYPDTIIVHLIRNPRDFARSYINHGAFRGVKGWMGNRVPFWFLRPEHVSRTDWPRWNEMPAADACIWRWSIMNETIERDSKRHASKYVRIRYEDLFSDSEHWETLSKLCGLDPAVWRNDPDLLRTNMSQPNKRESHYRSAGTQAGSAMRNVVEQMSRYGYGDAPD